MHKKPIQGALLALLAWLAGPAWADRTKSDVVYLANGDRVTGEIKTLDYASLKIETSNMGTISIEWPAVLKVTSPQSFTIEDRHGGKYTGSFGETGNNQLSIALAEGDRVALPLADVVRVSPIEAGFLNRINGSLAVGLNYTNSSDTGVASLNFTANYRSPNIESTLKLSMNTTKTDEGTSDRDQIANSTRFLRPRKQYWNVLSSIDRNEELGIDARIQLGAGYGRHLVQSAHTALDGTLGLSFNNEWSTGQEGSNQSLEGVINAEWHVFRFSDPETSLVSTLSVFPSLTESKRWRSQFDITLSRDFFKDFTLDLTYFNSYDSNPPDAEAGHKDYGIVTSLSYKF